MVNFRSIELNRLVSMKSGEAITAQHIDDYGEYPCFGGNGLRGYTNQYTHQGEYALIGRQGALCGNVTYVNGTFYASEHAVVVAPKEDNIIKYIYYVLEAMHLNQYVESSAQPGLSVNKLLNLLAYVSTDSNEQQRIATVLADIDAMISSLKTLIAKKKTIKQGAMQELLTGKKRLPGFSGEWNNYAFGNLFDFIPNNAFTRAQMADSGKVKNIHYGDILTKYGAYVEGNSGAIPYISKEIDLARFAERCYLQSGDIIVADTAEDETVGKALEVVNVDCPILAGQHTLLCRPKIMFAEKFLGYYLNAACYHDQLIPYIVGTKVSSVSKASVAQTKLVVPGYEEQQAIAEILSNMDAEIEALQQKLEKYRQLKQGMMQQLLTGKIRLV